VKRLEILDLIGIWAILICFTYEGSCEKLTVMIIVSAQEVFTTN